MESNLEEWEENFQEAYDIFFEIISEDSVDYALDFQQILLKK